MNYVDITIIILLLLGAWRGYRSGLLETLGGLAGFLLSLLLAVFYTRSLAAILDQSFGIIDWLKGWLNAHIPVAALLQQVERQSVSGVEQLSLPPFYQKLLVGYLGKSLAAGGTAYESVSEALAAAIASFLLQGITFLLIWFGSLLVLKVFFRLITRSIDKTLLGAVNRLAGTAVGFLTTYLVVGAIAALITPLLALYATRPESVFYSLSRSVAGSYLIPWLVNGFNFLAQEIFTRL
ncbi:CvpA family protein [Calderihabitans maritimus]|uniref:Colicin V production protein n=1 Tax=Calderihabitans maritimus TaxID=1246530 RepID=A0A1Z5HWP6_9FIRM|nr:CvpA family protein [Calderihabitans maritimus]GAW93700.1 hypothetical protein TherJR_2985 [Calderihabitans maritimus]